MNYEALCKLIDGIIENEVKHIKLFKESEFCNNNTYQKQLNQSVNQLTGKLIVTFSDEQKKIFDELFGLLVCENVNLQKFYFREGLRAGLIDLSFLNEMKIIESIL
ncbi:hypothetical protein [Clostridium tertium]|uniref:hypothetical protein n=1 Tax=Clostridium tertium TaxID=1559 RepID=UPI0035208E8F